MPSPPDRWDAYSPMGTVIPRTNFFACKVPLKESFLQRVSENDKFSPEILMGTLQQQGLKLGMIIDLTFTTKYYNTQEFEAQSVQHRKVFVPGQQVPNDSNFQEFAEAVKGFEKEDHVIGVHCTHGVNRTGYLICRYMIEELDFEPEEAIATFCEARGHGIERENYIADLFSRKKGQSSVTIRPLSEQTTRKKKPRWRENRQDHPGWRSGHHSDNAPSHHGSDTFRQPGWGGSRNWNHPSDRFGQETETMNNSRHPGSDQMNNSHSDSPRVQGGHNYQWSGSSRNIQGAHSNQWENGYGHRDNHRVIDTSSTYRDRAWNRSRPYDDVPRWGEGYRQPEGNRNFQPRSGSREQGSRWSSDLGDTRGGRRRDEQVDIFRSAGWGSSGRSVASDQQYGQFGRRDY